MNHRYLKAITITTVCMLLAGCFVRLIPTPGGKVIVESGNYPDCLAGEACDDIEISDLFFDEDFTAVPDEGFEFIRWVRADRFFFGCRTDETLRLYTSDLEGTKIEQYLFTDDVFFMQPLFRSTGPDIDYSADFECDDITAPNLGAENWRAFVNIFEADGSTYVGGYDVSPAPNGEQISNISGRQGGPEQGRLHLNVFSNYESAFNGINQHEQGQFVEVNVFQEFRLKAENAGTYTFTFDARLPEVAALTEPATAYAFVKVLDPGNGFLPVGEVATSNASDLGTEWETRKIVFELTEEVAGSGTILQFGFTSLATNFDGSGVLYDNVSFKISQ